MRHRFSSHTCNLPHRCRSRQPNCVRCIRMYAKVRSVNTSGISEAQDGRSSRI